MLRDRLRWLVTAGAGLKALLAAGLAHSLKGAAAMGEPGQAGGGSSTGQLRAPLEELLTPFPAHVLVSTGQFVIVLLWRGWGGGGLERAWPGRRGQ